MPTPKPPTLTLISECLLSKWGFNDGDEPDHFVDWWDEHEPDVDYPTLDWHRVLRALVRSHLLPALQQHHTIDIYDIETIHNPVRARTVDGIEIDDYSQTPQVELTPQSVTIPYADVMAVVRAEPDATPG